MVHRKIGHAKEAVRLLRRALGTAPQEARIHVEIARALTLMWRQRADDRKGTRDLERALSNLEEARKFGGNRMSREARTQIENVAAFVYIEKAFAERSKAGSLLESAKSHIRRMENLLSQEAWIGRFLDTRGYPRIPSGEYRAYCKWGKQYRDPGFRRWLCLLRWDVLSDDLLRVIATVPQWFPLGSRDKARASRRGKYLPEWVRANGGPPARRDRLSPGVFVYRIARVEIGDTEGPAPYSVVRRIVEWETGVPGSSVSKSTSQGRPPLSAVESEAFARCLSDSSPTGKRDGVVGETEGVFPTSPGEDFAFGDSKDESAASVCNPPPKFSFASARAGVECEHTPATTQGAGAPETAIPPKAREDAETTTQREGLLNRSVSASNCNDGGYEDA